MQPHLFTYKNGILEPSFLTISYSQLDLGKLLFIRAVLEVGVNIITELCTSYYWNTFVCNSTLLSNLLLGTYMLDL